MGKSSWWRNWKHVRGNAKWSFIEHTSKWLSEHPLFKWAIRMVTLGLFAAWAWLKRQGADVWILVALVLIICALILFMAAVKVFRRLQAPEINDTEPPDANLGAPVIEDHAVHDALNIKITNHWHDEDLSRSVLYLLRVTKWSDEWNGYGTVDTFRELPHCVILGDQTGLPKDKARTFQLLEFTNPSKPIIRAKLIPRGEFITWPIPLKGTWRIELQLRWDGGLLNIAKCFAWSNTSLPAFIDCLDGHLLPEQQIPNCELTSRGGETAIQADITGEFFNVIIRSYGSFIENEQKWLKFGLKMRMSLSASGDVRIEDIKMVAHRNSPMCKPFSTPSTIALTKGNPHDFPVHLQIEYLYDGGDTLPKSLDVVVTDEHRRTHLISLRVGDTLPAVPEVLR